MHRPAAGQVPGYPGFSRQHVERANHRVGCIQLEERAGVPTSERCQVGPAGQQMKDGFVLLVDQHFHPEKSRSVVHQVRPVSKGLLNRTLHAVCDFEHGHDQNHKNSFFIAPASLGCAANPRDAYITFKHKRLRARLGIRLLPWKVMRVRILAGIILLVPALTAQSGKDSRLNLTTGKEIFRAGCVGCHGPDGKGAPDTAVGFDKPKSFPDFTRCDQTTPELDVDWKATIRDGGPAGRGFSPIMPSFGEALTDHQIDLVIGYLRSLCTDKSWARGELNLPRPLITEKAFPESEAIITTSLNAQGAPGVSNTLVYEQQLSKRNQLEVAVPFGFTHDTGRWLGGIGDIEFGLKRVLFSNSRSILSAEGVLILTTGDKSKGLGNGVTEFEGFAAYGLLLPGQSFLQLQAGTQQPTNTLTAPQTVYWREAFGKSFRQGGGVGRLWTPMVEMVAERDLQTGAKTNWDIVPQFQVTLSRRQHVRFDAGVQIPATNTAGRSAQVVFYLLWDWFDGGLREGWK
jgi:hypothetical protein